MNVSPGPDGRMPESTRRPEGVRDRLRAAATRCWEWVALVGDRRVVSFVTLLFGFLMVSLTDALFFPTPPNPFTQRQITVPLVNTLLSGTFFIFSIVVSVNTLFVSQQQNPLGQQFGRIQSIVEFRRQLENVVDVDHVPARPDDFVRLLSGDILERAQYLEDDLSTMDFEVRENVDAYVSSLANETGEMNRALQDADSTFGIVLAMMDYNHDRQINDLRALRTAHSDKLSDRTDERIDEMLRLLQYFATAREYFKTLYTRREFATLSRDLVLTAVPTAAIIVSFMHFLDDLPNNEILVAAVEAVAFAPFVLVASYVLRVAIVSNRTQAAGQFVAEERTGDIEGIARDR